MITTGSNPNIVPLIKESILMEMMKKMELRMSFLELFIICFKSTSIPAKNIKYKKPTFDIISKYSWLYISPMKPSIEPIIISIGVTGMCKSLAIKGALHIVNDMVKSSVICADIRVYIRCLHLRHSCTSLPRKVFLPIRYPHSGQCSSIGSKLAINLHFG